VSPEEERALTALFGEGVRECSEGGLRLITLPAVMLPLGCTPATAFGIYVATPYAGYQSRLYLDAPVRLASGVIPPTSPALLLGRTMHAASIQAIPATLPVPEAILAHIRRYQLAA
jgi:hypothetical protein